MNNKRKRNIIIGILCTVLLLMVVGYAAFSSILNITGTSTIGSNWDVRITNIVSKNVVGGASNAEDPSHDVLTATFKTNLVSPGDSIEYDITVENKGNLNAKLDKITLTDPKNPAITFTSTGLTEGDKLNAGSNAILTVKVEYNSEVTAQPENTTSTLQVILDYSQAEGSVVGPSTITIDDLKETAVTEGDGLYVDNYEEGRYVYKGANPNNYITFNDESWRIIAIENDGALKILKSTNTIGKKHWEGTFDNNNWAKPTALNTYLNGEYYSSLNSDAIDLIVQHNFGIGQVTYNNTSLSAQIASENSTIWNGYIGLMSVSDVIRANSNTTLCGSFGLHNDANNKGTCKNTNYINSLVSMIETRAYLWTISATYNSTTGGGDDVVYIDAYGGFSYGSAYNSYYVLPALYLKPNITLLGSGTSDAPYIVKA